MKKKHFLNILIISLITFPSRYTAQEKDSIKQQKTVITTVDDDFVWPLIVGYEYFSPVGNLSSNMANLHGFHVGFQFKVAPKYVLDMRIFGAFGGDSNKRLIFTHEKTEFESYIKSIYGAKISINRNHRISSKNIFLTTQAGLGLQIFNSDKENKHYILNGVTGEFEEDPDKKSEPIGSVAPVFSAGIGIRKEFGKFPIGLNVNYNLAPHNLFGKMIQQKTGNSYLSVSVYTGFILPF